MNNNLPMLRHLTLGGERYDHDLCTRIEKILPDVKIHNIYASTETGSLLNAVGDVFEIPYDYRELIRISDKNELLIHRSLLAGFSLTNDWYNTHDLVEVKNDKLRFLSRKTDLINVGGYKVNPLEVEAMIQEIPGVIDCVVKGTENSVLGHILIAEIVREPMFTDKEVKKSIQCELKGKLQPFKIPRLIYFVDVINKTRTGKKVRK